MSGVRVERPSARILLLDREGRVLLFRFDAPDRAPFWATPGGALDPGETFAAGARRELLEETGLDLDCGSEVGRRLAEFVTLEDVPVAAASAISSSARRPARSQPPATPNSNGG